MNWLEISIGIIFLICIITGLIRGAVRIIVSLVATIVTLVIVFFATPYVSQTIEKYTPLDDMIRQKVVSTMADAATSAVSGGDSYSDKGGLTEEAVKKVLKAAGVSEEKLESYGISIADIVSGKVSSDDLAKYGISANVLDGLKNSGNESVENAIENADIPESLQETLIKSADIPAAFKNLLLKNNNEATYQKLGVTTFAQYVGAYIAKQVINIIAFILTFIVVTIILRAVVFALDIVTELPGVGALNHLAGGLFGMGIALVIVWIIFMVITLMYTTDIGKEIYRMVEDNTLLKLIYDGTLQPASYIKMDKAQYNNADYILVGSNYVKKSFVDNGFPSKQIIVNNYGMHLDYFKPTKLDSKEIYDLIMVGNWSKRKGCDVLIEVCKKYNYSLLHIGAISDVEFPNEINFKHHNTVPESELVNYYSKAKVFVLLSKDEGLALVQPQAVACGLPLVITKHTGGDDLLQYIDNKNYIKVVDNFNDIDEIGINIQNALDIANSQIGTRKYCNIENKLSWKAYGERLNKILFSIVK